MSGLRLRNSSKVPAQRCYLELRGLLVVAQLVVPVSHKLVVSTRWPGTCNIIVCRREDNLELRKHPLRLQHYAVVAGSPELI